MLAETLRRLLDERGISIAELSRKTEVPKSNINTWLQGASPNIEQADKVARYFGVTMEYLVFGREVKDSLEEFFERVEIHKGEYEISVKKLIRKK
jgi:transcriptional regulator with XRE-family HTH domain